MDEKELRGVPVEVLKEIAGSLRGGEIIRIGGSLNISFRGNKHWPSGLIPVSRLGICPEPDPFGPGTTRTRPGGIRKGLKYLRVVESQVRKRTP